MATLTTSTNHAGAAFTQVEQRTVLRNIRWETYSRIVADSSDQSAPRFAFSGGTLEIVAPSADHEQCISAIRAIIQVVVEEWDIDIRELGSTTVLREGVHFGFDPDLSYYAPNLGARHGKREVDLSTDSAPIIIVEADLSCPTINKLPLFARLGIPEVWQYTDGSLHILALAGDEYHASMRSVAFPLLSSERINQFLETSRTIRRPEWLRQIREWAHSMRSAN